MSISKAPYYSSHAWEIKETASYKLLKRGTMAVSDRELLATLVGNHDTATELLSTFGSLKALSRASISEYMQVKGVGRKTALILISAFELGRRKTYEDIHTVTVTGSASVASFLIGKYADHTHEVFSVLFLDRKNSIIEDSEIFIGGVSGVLVDPKIIFKKAVSCLASSIILAHNHPSGNLSPSEADHKITHMMVQAGKLLEIPVLDHIIISHTGYFSFADEGIL